MNSFDMQYIAHRRPDDEVGALHLLECHLKGTALMARSFAAAFGAEDWGELIGLWHDLGKYSEAFQTYIRSVTNADCHVADAGARTDHSTAGTQYAVEALPLLGHLVAYVVAGHHTGLLDGRSAEACLESRLRKSVEPWKSHAPPEFLKAPQLRIPPALKHAFARQDGFSAAFFTRMLFSCLVDADFLDTEQFMQPDQFRERPQWPDDILSRMDAALSVYVNETFGLPTNPVDRWRAKVREACIAKAADSPGLFSLTVPTGGGKTLASLAFALRHAVTHSLRRVVYVAPLTTIIEQNADVFRKALKRVSDELRLDVVIEHHSNFDPEKETTATRLATENWDAPLIVTTAVQFYESLFSNKPSKCRKLHRLARSVIVLDEAQTLPVDYLAPCLRAIRELTDHYGCSIVLCTATQPAVQRRDQFDIGLPAVREIIPEPRSLYLKLRRVRTRYIETVEDADLAQRLAREKQVLCIVNTRKHAKTLFERVRKYCDDTYTVFHLSALMCPAHRTFVLESIRRQIGEGENLRVVSTQLMEAGVDIDFPVVYRALAGIDSIAQAAGRCNRNGRFSELGRLYIFRSESKYSKAERFVRDTANCAGQILALYPDPLELEPVEHYFRVYYWDQQIRWDAKHILDAFAIVNDRNFPFLFDFQKAADKFRLIDEVYKPVIIPWGSQGKRLCSALRDHPFPDRRIRCQLQRFTVQVPERDWIRHVDNGTIELVQDRFPVLVCPDAYYSDELGLDLDRPDPAGMIV